MLEVSRTLVYNRRKDFLDYAEKEGLSVATEYYDLVETFDGLMELSRMLKANNLSINDAKQGVEIVEIMNDFQVENPEEFMSEVISEAESRELSGEEITRYSSELKRLEEETGRSYTQLIDEMESIQEKHKDLEKTQMMLEEQVHAVRSELEKSLDEAEVTKKRVEDFVEVRDSLGDFDVSLDDLDLLEKALRNLDELDYEVKEIIDFYSQSKLIREELEINIKENERLKERNEALLKENGELEEKLERNLEMSTAVKSQLEAGIEPGDILDIVNTVKDVGEVLGLDESEAINRFVTDVKTGYNERSGYTFRVDEFKEIKRALEEKNSLLRERLGVLEEVLDDRSRTVEALRRMDALGLEDSELIEWRELLEDHDYNVTSFRAEVIKLGGLHPLVEEKTGHIKELEAKETELESTVEELERKVSAVQSTLDKLRTDIESETGKIREAVEDFEKYFTSPETGFKARTRRIVDDIIANLTVILMETRQEWDEDLEHLDETVKKIVEETDRILANAYAGGRLVGKFHSLEPIMGLLREEQVPRMEATIGVITMLGYIKLWLGEHYPDDLYESCDVVIERLTRDLGDIYK